MAKNVYGSKNKVVIVKGYKVSLKKSHVKFISSTFLPDPPKPPPRPPELKVCEPALAATNNKKNISIKFLPKKGS